MTVSHELHLLVRTRDGQCFVHRVDDAHVCRDTWGSAHSAYDLQRLTVDHVNMTPTMSKRAPDDAQHLVAMCADSNVRGPSRVVRQAERAYLLGLYAV